MCRLRPVRQNLRLSSRRHDAFHIAQGVFFLHAAVNSLYRIRMARMGSRAAARRAGR